MAVPKKGLSSIHKKETSGSRSLFGDLEINTAGMDPSEQTLETTKRLRTEYIDIAKIEDNDNNKFIVKDVEVMKQSILKIGIVQPIVLINILDESKVPTGRYRIKAGSRRFAAVKEIVNDAIKDNNQELVEKYKRIFSIVMPVGITDEETEKLYIDTNTTARQLTLEEIFKHFDYFFQSDKEGNILNIPKNVNKIDYIIRTFKSMGFGDIGSTKVKEYIAIYTAHNKEIKSDFENGFLNRQQAVTVARMPEAMQDEVMKKFKKMPEKDIKDYIKTYNLEKKSDKLTGKIKGIDAVGDTLKAAVKMKSLSKMNAIVFADNQEKNQLKENINELKGLLKEIEEKFLK